MGEQDLEERLKEIRGIIKRMDKRWDNGFFTDEQEYVEQRLKLQMELEKLTPVPNDELERAADILEILRRTGKGWMEMKKVDMN